ncbi:MAG: oxaloacetate decarboxylase gamma subunit [Paraglaciecola sp.]|jgi:oxaloacetate decarboxylase gamma subunit
MDIELSGMLSEAATLLLVGMSVVFTFLSLLIGSVNLIAWVCAKYPEVPESLALRMPGQAVSSSSTTQNVSPSTVAAISAAIHQHRNAQ